MDQTTTISITEARKRLFQIAKEVQTPGRSYTLTEKGKPKVIVISFEEYDSLKETIEVLTDCPDLKKTIDEVERDIKSGEYKNYPTLEEVMMEHGYMLADKGKIKYGVADTVRKKSKKRTR